MREQSGKLHRVPAGNRPRLSKCSPSRAMKVKCSMSIEVRSVTAFTGTKTSDADRAHLKEYGFVHVTGLRVSGNGGYIIGDRLKPEGFGKWDYNNGTYVIVTTGGEVWIGLYWDTLRDLTNELCPNGQGAFVPCSNGEQIAMKDMLQRIANPSYGLTYPE